MTKSTTKRKEGENKICLNKDILILSSIIETLH